MVEKLQSWFEFNRPLVLFVYGLVFFVLGLSIIMQSRRYSRLNLARSLIWLAAFGFTHAFHEWGDLFLPIQSQYTPSPIVEILRSFQHLLLALSFGCLLQFGVELFQPLPSKLRWIRFLPITVFTLWLAGPFWFGLVISKDVQAWHTFVKITARYFLCIPGGLLAAFGLLRQNRLQIQKLDVPHVSRMINLAALMMALYGIMGGLIVPPAPFFPANVINVETFARVFIAPHPIFRSIIGLLLTLFIVRAMQIFDVETERLIRQMEIREVLQLEQERIARELHDGALQRVYAAGLLVESLSRRAKGNLRTDLDRLAETINDSIEQLRSFLPRLMPAPQAAELVPALQAVVEEASLSIPIELECQVDEPPALSPEQVGHILAFTREATSNAIRHARSPRIEVRLQCSPQALILTVSDFGKGMENPVDGGYGLRNMRDRARLLGGNLKISSQPGKGTTVTLDIPLESLK